MTRAAYLRRRGELRRCGCRDLPYLHHVNPELHIRRSWRTHPPLSVG